MVKLHSLFRTVIFFLSLIDGTAAAGEFPGFLTLRHEKLRFVVGKERIGLYKLPSHFLNLLHEVFRVCLPLCYLGQTVFSFCGQLRGSEGFRQDAYKVDTALYRK